MSPIQIALFLLAVLFFLTGKYVAYHSAKTDDEVDKEDLFWGWYLFKNKTSIILFISGIICFVLLIFVHHSAT